MSTDVETGVAVPKSSDLERRIDATFLRDKLTAAFLVVALWATVILVMLSVRGYIDNKSVEALCWIGAGFLLLFNTSSITAMIRHYGQDKAHIYAIDIRHLDAGQ